MVLLYQYTPCGFMKIIIIENVSVVITYVFVYVNIYVVSLIVTYYYLCNLLCQRKHCLVMPIKLFKN